jgi:magnesium chelatase subunit H
MRLPLNGRLMETNESLSWTPDQNTLNAMRCAGDEIEDRLAGITEGVNQ